MLSATCPRPYASNIELNPRERITVGPNYQVGFAAEDRRRTNMLVRAVGLIQNAKNAEEIISENKADMVAITRAMLANPRWPWQAAHELGATLSTDVNIGRNFQTDGTAINSN